MLKVVALAVSGALFALGGGFGLDLAMKKDVTVVVDGERRDVSTSSSTVAGVLIDEGLKLGQHDVVSPAPAEAISAGDSIEVEYGRQVTANVDGKTTTFWTTARTVGDALSHIDVRTTNYKVSTSRSTEIGRDGLDFSVDSLFSVTVNAGGTSRKVEASGTVADALAAAKVTTDADDKISQGLNVALADGLTITVVKVDVKTSTATSAVAHKSKVTTSSSLAKGVTQIKVQGQDGTKSETVVIRYEDGKQVSRKVTASKVTKAPVDEVKVVGTRTSSSSSSSSSSGSSSSGSSGGSTSTTPATGASCGASYYTSGSVTASGEAFNTNDFTAAHKTLPFGTKVKVTNTANGKTTIVRINDRGPFVSGRCLDLSRAAMSAVGGLSSGVITVKYQVL